MREQLPAAHEHPALPAALQGRTGWRTRSNRSSWTIRCRPPPAASASIPAKAAAAGRRVDEPINMREVHRVIADSILLSDRFDAMAAQGRRQAAAGDRQEDRRGRRRPGRADRRVLPGAAGARGRRCYESHAEPGGMLRFALPDYRLPRNVLDREIEIIRRLGVQVRAELAHRRRYLAERPGRAVRRGVPVARHLEGNAGPHLPGNELAGVFGSLHFLEGEAHGRRTDLGAARRSSSAAATAAIDCARTAIRKGASATVIYRRERKDMPAIAEEVDAAEEEGVKLRLPGVAAPHRRRATARSRRSR